VNTRSDHDSCGISDSQVAGLQIRVRKSTANWSVRRRLHNLQRRFCLEPVVAGAQDCEKLGD
jgi:hypothetical protein